MVEIPAEVRTHEHEWEDANVVIDTSPPTYVWLCECGAVTHHKDTGELCERCTKRQLRQT